jgi:hypothetical protein
MSVPEILQISTLGRPKDFLDAKLPPAERVQANQYIYNVQDCNVFIEYNNAVVVYVAADLFRYEKNDAGQYTKSACPFEVAPVLRPVYSESDEIYYAQNHPPFPDSNLDITLIDMIDYRHDDVRIAHACIDCGNYSEPYVEFASYGAHASGFLNLYYMIDYDGTEHKNWTAFQAALDDASDDPDDYDFVEAAEFCGKNIRSFLGPVESAEVRRVGIGRGARTWTGPESFNCLQ